MKMYKKKLRNQIKDNMPPKGMSISMILAVISIACMIIALGGTGFATDAVQTTGTCIDSMNILYTTTFTLDGVTKTITSTNTCLNGCMQDATDFGDECIKTKANQTELIPIILWIFGFGFIIWFRRIYRSDAMNSLFLFFNAMAGVLVTQSILIMIPVILTLINVIYAWTKPNWHRGGD